MDPVQAILNYLSAMADGETDRMDEINSDLTEWIGKGGFFLAVDLTDLVNRIG